MKAMDFQRPLSLRQMADKHREYLEVIAPFVQAKANVIAMMMPSIIVYGNGVVEVKYSQNDQGVIDGIDATIRQIQDLYLPKIDPNPAPLR